MELKKNPEADLRRFRGLFLNIGLSVSLLITVVAFNWSSGGDELMDLIGQGDDDEEVIEIPPTEQPPPPPPPEIKVPEIKEVEKEEEEEEEEILFEEPEEEDAVEDLPEEEPEEEVSNEPFLIVEQPAVPPGGDLAFRTHIAKYLQKNYPERAKRAGIAGKVFVYFVIEKDGKPSNFKILKGIGGGCDEQAIAAIKGYGSWSPPKQRGRPVRQAFRMPINFRLQ